MDQLRFGLKSGFVVEFLLSEGPHKDGRYLRLFELFEAPDQKFRLFQNVLINNKITYGTALRPMTYLNQKIDFHGYFSGSGMMDAGGATAPPAGGPATVNPVEEGLIHTFNHSGDVTPPQVQKSTCSPHR